MGVSKVGGARLYLLRIFAGSANIFGIRRRKSSEAEARPSEKPASLSWDTKMQINPDRNRKNYRRASLMLYIRQPYQLSPSYTLPLAVCILMIPMLMVVSEHVQQATTYYMNQCGHMAFSQAPLVLPSLNNVLPAMVLQKSLVRLNIRSHSSVHCVSSSYSSTVCSGMVWRMVGVVVALLLLMSGDIEMNPGPIGNKLTSDDLGCVLEEVLDVAAQWYLLGLQLKVRTGTLDRIRAQYQNPQDQLLEMLKTWMSTSDNTSWKTLTGALRSRSVGACQLAGDLEMKYCVVEEPGVHSGTSTSDSQPEANVNPPSPVSGQVGPIPQPGGSELQQIMGGWNSKPVSSEHKLAETTHSVQHNLQHNLPGAKVRSKLDSVKHQAFQKCFAVLSDGISDPGWLAIQLYSKDMISRDMRRESELETIPAPTRTRKLLSAVEDQIITSPTSKFRDFLNTLHSEPSLEHLARKLEEAYRGLLSTTSGAHEGGRSVKSRDGGEELSVPAAKRKCVRDEDSVSSSETLSVCAKSATLPEHVPSQQWSIFQSFPQTLCHPLSDPSQVQLPQSHQLLIQPYMHQSSNSLSFQSPSSHQPPSHTPIHCPPPVIFNPILEKYIIFLRAYYTNHKFTSTKWPHLDARNYINLAVITSEYADREELVEFRQQTIRGSIDDILEWKVPIEMKNILKPNCVYDIHDDEKHEHYPVTKLLVEGAPGIGKSTFAWELCHKWAQCNLFNEYSLVVLLKFRDKRVQEARSVSELFYHPNSKLQSEIVDHITTTGGHGLLLILEGFDEAPASKRTMDSIFARLFMGQELPKATVILTTRPSASAELRRFCKGVNSRRIEIVGFGKKEIDDYIQCAFSNEQTRSDFSEYLSLYPHIHSMMYVPLNSAIVTHVYESCKSRGTVVPKTMTQLYSSLIRTLLLRYLKDKEEYKDTCMNINRFKDLPRPVYDHFCKICEIAYTGIMSADTELIFQDLPSNFDPLGLMQTCPELYVDRGASVSYNFLHLTVQEYLAAYHISQQSRDEQVAFMREHIESKKLEVVVRFLAGLSELGRDLWDVVRGFASMIRAIDIFLPESASKARPSLIKEETSFIKLEILHCLFESQDPSAITGILGSGYVCFSQNCSNALPFDWYVLGYCITNSSCEWKLELKQCKLESVETFVRAINLQQSQCLFPSMQKVKGVWLRECKPAADDLLVANIPQMSVFHNRIHLCLMNNRLKSNTCNLLSKHTDLLQHLQFLNLSGNHIGRGGAVNLITSLTKFSTIRALHLYATGIGFEDCKVLSELLASSKYIQVLDISNNDLSSDSIELIVDELSHNSLEKLNLSHSNFSSKNVFNLASKLRVNTRLKELNIRWCNITSGDSIHLAKALEENTATQLQTLWLWKNSIGSEGAVAFAGMLATNKSLSKLNMRWCSIRVEGAVCLAKAMERNSTLSELDISYNSIGSKGAVAFASMLKRNQCLKTLWLIDGSVDVDGVLELIESLKHNSVLEKLWLTNGCKPPSFSTLDKSMQDCVKFC